MGPKAYRNRVFGEIAFAPDFHSLKMLTGLDNLLRNHFQNAQIYDQTRFSQVTYFVLAPDRQKRLPGVQSSADISG